ncbi:aldose 1-epimerase family protein [Stieleria sp. JC731]|uniref:aldose 1-epimerase family protein n=1 Tax=Pirellulaceae TaxID=2691357 RepID=UPI001E4BE9FF|nr:aldose 1-epimerase family protein [Stieleria sp. JC731]MCC9603987.1 aldose 1-epimerase family protein [Stieleria sp. JC731]
MVKTRTLRSIDDRTQSILWYEKSPLALMVETAEGTITCKHGRFVGGRSDGVEIVRIDTGAIVLDVLPTRGMAIWKIESRDTRFGWDSPIDGPVHPSLVPTYDPSGLGWLEGFDELLTRCGLNSNGAPEHDNSGKLVHPLHGRIGNLPADGLVVEYDEVAGRLELIGEIRESRLFFPNLRLVSRIRVHVGSTKVDVLDDVTNDGSQEATMQLLYHINVGSPVLEAGSKVVMPIEELAPKDSLSAGEIETWDKYEGPQSGYSERVYFAKLRSDDHDQTTVMLHNAGADRGLAVTSSTRTLPRFIVWKNTGDLADGYVTGLEPATNYPNTRSFEAKQDRVLKIAPEQTICFRVSLEPLTDSEAVNATRDRIDLIAGSDPTKIHSTPRPGWTPGA